MSVLVLGLLYCKEAGVVGQRGEGLNMVDLSLLPLTPIMGSGQAPLQVRLSLIALPHISLLMHSAWVGRRDMRCAIVCANWVQREYIQLAQSPPCFTVKRGVGGVSWSCSRTVPR